MSQELPKPCGVLYWCDFTTFLVHADSGHLCGNIGGLIITASLVRFPWVSKRHIFLDSYFSRGFCQSTVFHVIVFIISTVIATSCYPYVMGYFIESTQTHIVGASAAIFGLIGTAFICGIVDLMWLMLQFNFRSIISQFESDPQAAIGTFSKISWSLFWLLHQCIFYPNQPTGGKVSTCEHLIGFVAGVIITSTTLLVLELINHLTSNSRKQSNNFNCSYNNVLPSNQVEMASIV